MAFLIATTTLSSAVASGGTFTINAPTATLAGAIKNGGGHVMSVRGLQANFNFPNDWTVSWAAAVATITYNGATTIPAGSLVSVQFELAGDNQNFPYHTVNSNQIDKSTQQAYRGAFGQVFRVDFGAPLAASATTVVNAGARTGAGTVTTYAAPVVLDVPRVLQFVSSNAGDTTQTVTVKGFDEYGVAMTETITANGTTIVNGKKAFKTVVSDTTSATFAGNLSIGILATLGLPYYLAAQTGTGIGNILKESQDGATPTAGTAVGGVLTKASATTGDVRGTIAPNVAPDGTKVYSVYMFVADIDFKGVPQFS